jgi:glycolate oxidase
LLSDAEELRPYECDGLTAYRELPLVVVIPDTVEEVCGVMRLCSAHGVSLVARGAGTSLSGGARPDRNGVLLSLAKFNRILVLFLF